MMHLNIVHSLKNYAWILNGEQAWLVAYALKVGVKS